MSEKLLTSTAFADTGLHPDVVTALNSLGYEYCSPIQAQCIPELVMGHDVEGQAQTGTGKTLAFLSAIFHHLVIAREDGDMGARAYAKALVVAPTRELAVQIHADAEALNRFLNFRLGLAYGGEPTEVQERKLRGGCDLLIGTPGRLIDFFKSRVIHFSRVEMVVLDEADRMFDMGFIRDIRFILNRLAPAENRLSMLFSATMSFKVQELAYEHMRSPIPIKVESSRGVVADTVAEEMFYPSNEDKMTLLLTLIEDEWPDKAIVFANTRATAERIQAYLIADGHRSGLLIGSLEQRIRQRTLDAFAAGDLDFLVATDVAARGLHIPDVSHVFNYDLPEDCEDYVHRIGRTGRAGKSGKAISFACERYVINLERIEEYIGHKIPVSKYDPNALLDDIPEVFIKPSASRESGPKRHNSVHGGANSSFGGRNRGFGNRFGGRKG